MWFTILLGNSDKFGIARIVAYPNRPRSLELCYICFLLRIAHPGSPMIQDRSRSWIDYDPTSSVYYLFAMTTQSIRMQLWIVPDLRALLVISLPIIVFYLVSVPASAQEPRIVGDPPQKILKNKLMFPTGKVLVVLPKGLRAFTVEDFVKHYGTDARPEYAFIDDSTESRYTVSLLNSKLAPTDLEAYRVKLEKTLAKSMTNLVWFKREMLKFGETEWAHLEMQNQTSDGSTVMSDFYVTSMGGQPLVFTVMTNTNYWYDLRKTMQKMMLSVTVHPSRMADHPSTTTQK